MINGIRQLQRKLGMSEGELLRLARELGHDGALISINHTTAAQRLALFQMLDAIVACDLEIAHFVCGSATPAKVLQSPHVEDRTDQRAEA